MNSDSTPESENKAMKANKNISAPQPQNMGLVSQKDPKPKQRHDDMRQSLPKSAKIQIRHKLIFYSFGSLVVIPAILVSLYLYIFAADQFQSTSAFSVRKQDLSSAMSIFGGLTNLSAGASDSDVIYEYIQSQNMVETIDEKLDLRTMWGVHRATDPFFGLSAEATIEDLVDYWNSMVRIRLDTSSGSLTLETRAFTAEAAQNLNEAILQQSSEEVEALSRIAQDDAIQLARAEMERTLERLKEARVEMATFRRQNQIIDPSANFQAQMGIVSGLEQQLVAALIERDMLVGTVKTGDPRLAQVDRRIVVIRDRIEKERENIGADYVFSSSTPDQTSSSQINEDAEKSQLYQTVGKYESLLVDQEFAQQAYTAALVALDEALADAKRKSRYLATHITPTLAQTAEYPERMIIWSIFLLVDFLAWMLFVLIIYALRDRR